MAAALVPGTEVRSRGLHWQVVASEKLGAQTLYRLRGLDGAVRGLEFDILHPFEDVEPLQADLVPEQAAPLPNWLVYHQAFLLEQALGSFAILAVQPGRLRMEPYQLVPVLRALRMSRVRLLLADGVGLGKTIQSGLVVSELIARRLAHRILVVSPAGPLLQQWHTEMSERFGLRLETVDRAKLEEIRRSSELGANPFDRLPLALASIDFLKQERILDQLERASYDIVIVDEAHHCTDTGGTADREDSQRRRLAQVLARRCDALLLATATPHDGHDRSFASLCELLDPSLVDGRGALRGIQYKAHVVRRLKVHVRDPATGKDVFPTREVIPSPVTADSGQHDAFIRLQRDLIDLIAPELRRAFRARRYSDVLSFIALLKRSVSTVKACRSTLEVVADRFHRMLTEGAEQQDALRERRRTLRDYRKKMDRFGVLATEEEEDLGVIEAEDIACQLAETEREVRRGSYRLKNAASVVDALEGLIETAQEATDGDPKLDAMVAAIRSIRESEPRANVIIYSEYATSMEAAAQRLGSENLGTILTLKGEDDDRTRTAVTDRFRSQDNVILVSTDASAEGLNLHQRCHHLIHVELPFNPNRLEQRNGRIDRYGQKHAPIVRYLYLRKTFEERVLLRLIAKYERQRAKLTFVPNTLGITTSTEAASARLLKPFLEEDTKLFQQGEPVLFNIETDEEEDPVTDAATAELLEEIDRSLSSYYEASRNNSWMADDGLNAEQRLVTEASEARESGTHAGNVDIAEFVCNAIRLDGGAVTGSTTDSIFTLRLPPAWKSGLEDLPGYDGDAGIVRLTTHLDVSRDDQDHQVGFLGRAHPLVRRALDRVRSISLGGNLQAGQDARVSAVQGDVSEPALLYTFLGRVFSGAGREYERVLGVLVSPSEPPRFLAEARDWLNLARMESAIRTTDVWKNHFADWADHAADQSAQAARQGLSPIADEFARDHTQRLTEEVEQQKAWLARRAEEVTAAAVEPAPDRTLFDADAAPATPRPQWRTETDPQRRLAAFHQDTSQHPARRSEAEGVLRIYEQRMGELQARLDLHEPEVVPLGLLMIAPKEAGHGA